MVKTWSFCVARNWNTLQNIQGKNLHIIMFQLHDEIKKNSLTFSHSLQPLSMFRWNCIPIL